MSYQKVDNDHASTVAVSVSLMSEVTKKDEHNYNNNNITGNIYNNKIEAISMEAIELSLVTSGEQSNIKNDYDRDQRNHNEDGEDYVDDRQEESHHHHHHHHDDTIVKNHDANQHQKYESQHDDYHTHVEIHHDNHKNNKNNTRNHDHTRVDPSMFMYQPSSISTSSPTHGGGGGGGSRGGDSRESVRTYIICDCCCYGVFNPCGDFINSLINGCCCCGCCDADAFSMMNCCCCCDVGNICSFPDVFSMINCCSCCDVSGNISICSSSDVIPTIISQCCDVCSNNICSVDFLSIINYCYDSSNVCISCLSDLPLRSICETLLDIFRICAE